MVLKLYYEKNGHTYVKNVRSYKQMDVEAKNLQKKGFKISGANYYN